MPRRLVLVHAHPDDEAITTGGLMASCAASGHHVCLVTCTDGQLGEIDPASGLGADAVGARLGEVRRQELAESCRALGVSDVRLLGYHDSGMDGTPENKAPGAFVNQDFDEVVARIAGVYRDVRPDVVVTYDEKGLYGHPDHIMAHRAAMAAVDVAADRPAPDGWAVPRLCYAVMARSALAECRRLLLSGPDPSLAESLFSEENIAFVGTPDEAVHVRVDVSAHVERKIQALLAHLTQWGTTREFIDLPDEVRTMLLSTEYFVVTRGVAATDPGDIWSGLDA